MKKNIFMPIFFVATVLAISFSCKKGSESQKQEEKKKPVAQSYLWGANDDKYLEALKRFGKKFHDSRVSDYCVNMAYDSTYGWFSDPDSVLIEGPYDTATVTSANTDVQNCTEWITLVEDATTYLNSEGYSDIVSIWDDSPKHHWLIHAANALLDLKYQMEPEQRKGSKTQGFWNCVFQALGFSALAELGADWATMSRQVIISRVGKLLLKHAGIFGAAIAVISFIDCITD